MRVSTSLTLDARHQVFKVKKNARFKRSGRFEVGRWANFQSPISLVWIQRFSLKDRAMA